MFCPRCGKKPPDVASFCHACGSHLPILEIRAAAGPVPAPPETQPPQGDPAADPVRCSRLVPFVQAACLLALFGTAAYGYLLSGSRPSMASVADPEEAARALKPLSPAFCQSDTVYGLPSEGRGTGVVASLSPALLRHLKKEGVAVDPQPDYPGPLPLLLLLAVGVGLFAAALRGGGSARPALPISGITGCVLLVGFMLIYVYTWAVGAHVDCSEAGILRRAALAFESSGIKGLLDRFETQHELSLLRTGFGGGEDDLEFPELYPSDPAESKDPFKRVIGIIRPHSLEGLIGIEQFRSWKALSAWLFDSVFRWILGLVLLAALLGRIRRALEMRSLRAPVWIAAFFVVFLAPGALLLARRDPSEPAFGYWLGFLFCGWLCWLLASRAAAGPVSFPFLPGPKAVLQASVVVLALALPPVARAEQPAPSQGPSDSIDWDGHALRPGDVINFYQGPNPGHTALYLGRNECGEPSFFDFYPLSHRAPGAKESNHWGRIVNEVHLVRGSQDYESFRVFRLRDATVDTDALAREAKRLAGKTWVVYPNRWLDNCSSAVGKALEKGTGRTLGTANMPVSFDRSTSAFDEVTTRPVRVRDVLRQADRRFGEWVKEADERCRNQSAVPPASPGGIALGSLLSLPPDFPPARRIAAAGDRLIIETDSGNFAIDGIDPGDFATLLRSVVLLGEVPVLTIGTEPSGVTGYARVSYFGSIRHTGVGLRMYEADLKFKAAFLGLGSGPKGSTVPEADALLHRYPGSGGESTRLWIVGTGVRASSDRAGGGRMFAREHGLRFRGETTLRGSPVHDPELEAYTDELSRRWNVLTDHLPEFKALEPLVFGTALALWIRSEAIPVAPEVWEIPARWRRTPDLAPLVGTVTREGFAVVAGGVSLVPDERTGLGALLLRDLRSAVARRDSLGPGTALLLALAGLLLTLGLPSALLALASRRSGGPGISLGRAMAAWAFSIGMMLLALAIIPPWIFRPLLRPSDAELATFLLLTVGPLLVLPRILRTVSRRSTPTISGGWRAVPALLSLGMPLHLILCGATVCLLLAGLGVRGPAERIASAVLSPAERLVELVANHDPVRARILPGPRSIIRAQHHPLSVPPEAARAAQADTLTRPLAAMNPRFPWVRLLRIAHPETQGRAGRAHYTLTGEPPY